MKKGLKIKFPLRAKCRLGGGFLGVSLLLNVRKFLMVFLLGFYRNASLGSEDLIQLKFSCNGREEN